MNIFSNNYTLIIKNKVSRDSPNTDFLQERCKVSL